MASTEQNPKTRYQIYYENNRDKCIAKVKAYYCANRESELRKDREYRNKNPEKVAATEAAYREKNREKLRLAAKERYKKSPEKAREIQREYYKRHRNEILAAAKTYRELNPDKIKTAQAKHYLKNRDEICAKSRETNKLFRHKRLQVERKYISKNRGKVYEKISKREALKKSRLHHGSNSSEIAKIYSDCESVTKSSGVLHSVDHIIPLARGGWHHQDNLQIITKSMNCQKQADAFWISPHVGIKDWRDVPRDLWPEKLAQKYTSLIEQHKGETVRWDAAA